MNHPAHHHVHIESHVDRYMTRDVASVSSTTTLLEVNRILEERRISCVLVERDGEPIGVVSRTDLLRSARRDAGGAADPLAPLRSTPVSDLCKRAPVTVDPGSSVSIAAALMMKERVHRVFVRDGGKIVGVLSTHDVLQAIVAARVPTLLKDVMSQPLYTIPVDASVAQATDRLAKAHVSGLTVVDEEGWPVGFYAQTEALSARDKPAGASIEDAMSHALVCLHERAELHRAAALARASRARRVLVIHDRQAIGVLSPLDFARAVSG